MLYLIGGATRSGKTTLAREMLARRGVPWFSLDMLRTGLRHGAPGLGLDLSQGDLDAADRLWPVVQPLLDSILFFDVPYLVEGSCLRPSHLARFQARRSEADIRILFLGYPGTAPDRKLSQLEAHGGVNDWLAARPRAARAGQVARGLADSRALARECARAGLPFLDTGEDFAAAISGAVSLLTVEPPRT